MTGPPAAPVQARRDPAAEASAEAGGGPGPGGGTGLRGGHPGPFQRHASRGACAAPLWAVAAAQEAEEERQKALQWFQTLPHLLSALLLLCELTEGGVS